MKIAALVASLLAAGGGATLVGRSTNSCTPPPVVPAPLDAATDGAALDGAMDGPALDRDAATLPDANATASSADAAPDAVTAARCDSVGPRTIRASGRRRAPRIVGGTAALEGRYPFAVAISTASRFQYCGGTIISPRHVLTAAHCQVEPGDLALVGSVDLLKTRSVRITQSRIHRAFDPETMDYDVALAVLAEDVVPSVTLAPNAVPGNSTTIGWGAIREGGPSSSFLQQVEVPLWTAEDCRRVYPTLTPRQICAGRVTGGADSCQGDSGGALLVSVDGAEGAWRQLGVVSYGVGCARPNVPGVYTDLRAAEIRAWITACSR